MNINAMITNLLSDWRAILLAWALLNMLIYVAVGTVIIYIWDRKNMKAVLDNDPDFKNHMKVTFPHLSDDELARAVPSILGAALIAPGGLGVKYANRYFIDGPHIESSTPGIKGILGKKDFEFAVKLITNRGGIEETMTWDYIWRYVLLAVILLSLPVFWGLIPYVTVIYGGHFHKVFSYVYQFGKDPEVTSALYKREDWETWKDTIINLQAYIEETIKKREG